MEIQPLGNTISTHCGIIVGASTRPPDCACAKSGYIVIISKCFIHVIYPVFLRAKAPRRQGQASSR